MLFRGGGGGEGTHPCYKTCVPQVKILLRLIDTFLFFRYIDVIEKVNIMNGSGDLTKQQLKEMYEKLTSKNFNPQEIEFVLLDMKEKLDEGFRSTTVAE